jgi:hypothetical protein
VSFAKQNSISNAKCCDRHGGGAIAKLMAIYAMPRDEEKDCQPMTCKSVQTENRYRTGGGDIWD